MFSSYEFSRHIYSEELPCITDSKEKNVEARNTITHVYMRTQNEDEAEFDLYIFRGMKVYSHRRSRRHLN